MNCYVVPGLVAHVLISTSRIYVESAASEHSDEMCRLTGIDRGNFTQPDIV